MFFLRFYYTGQFSKEYFKQTFFGVFLSTFVPSLFFQSLWFYSVKIFNYHIDLSILGDLISKDPLSLTFKNIQDNFSVIILYNVTLIVFSSLIGYGLGYFITKNKLDRKYKLLRFKNAWHYIFTGQFFDFPRATYDLTKDKPEEIDYIFIDALVQIKEGTMLYEGMLVGYVLSDKLGLETITLMEAKRRYLKDDFSNKKAKHYNIPGHVIVLKYSEIVNLNFSYFKLEVTENNQLLPVLIK